MLVLSRRKDESIFVGQDIVIKVVEIRRNRVRLAIDAPLDITVHREEVRKRIEDTDPAVQT